MSFLSPNKFTIEQQIARAQLQSGDKSLEKQARDDVGAFPSLGTVYSLQSKKFTQDEIKEVETYIAEQKAKYPDSLKDLFDLWERMVKGKQHVLLNTQTQSQTLSNAVNSNTTQVPATVSTGSDNAAIPIEVDIPIPITPDFISGDTHRVDGLPEATRRPIVEQIPVPQVPAMPTPLQPPEAVSEPEAVEMAPTLTQLTQAVEEFRKTYQAVNDKTNKILPDHEKDIESRNKAIQQSAGPVAKILQTLDPSKLSESERKIYESMKLEVAKYFSNELSGIRSRQYTDYSFAFSLAESIIAPILKESGITLPKPPTQDDVEKRMKSINPSLHARYMKVLGKGWTLGQFLSNPKIRSEWADVQAKINGEYEDRIQKQLSELIGNKAVLKTTEQYEALTLMTTIMGSSNFLDFKKRNIDNWIQTGGAIGSAIGGGIAGVAIIGTTGWTGVGAVAGASVIGASIATAGAALSRGRYDEKYLLTEGGINLATFGVAGTIGKIAKARYIDQGSKIAGYSLDGTAGLALGVTGEYTRALTDGANFNDLPHGKMILMQLPWALLPMTMGGLAHLKGRAQNIERSVQTIRSQANVGDYAGAARTAETIAPEVENIANAARAQVQENHTVIPSPEPSMAPATEVRATTGRFNIPEGHILSSITSRKGINEVRAKQKIDPNYKPEIVDSEGRVYFVDRISGLNGVEILSLRNKQTLEGSTITAQELTSGNKFALIKEEVARVNPAPNPNSAPARSTRASEVPQAPTTATPQMNEQQFTEWFTALIPKVDKKRFPVGSTIKSEGVEITALAGGKYSMKHNGVVYSYDSHAELTANIGKIIKTPSERLSLLKSTESARILNHMQGYTGIEVPGVPGLRWKHDGHGKMSFERKNPENGSWNSVEITALSQDEQLAAVAHWYSIKPRQILEGIKKTEGATTHEALESHGLTGWFKKQPTVIQKKIEDGFKKGKNGTLEAGKTAIGIPGSILGWVTNWGHGAPWGKSFATGAVIEGVSMTISPSDKDHWRDENGNINWGNFGEALAYSLIAANCGISRAIFVSGAVGAYDLYEHSSAARTPGAQVPPPAK